MAVVDEEALEEEAVAAAAIVPGRQSWSAPRWVIDAAIFLSARVVIFGALFIVTVLRPGTRLIHLLHMWDADWYVKAAANGYPSTLPQVAGPEAQSTIAFFPLFPLLIRLVHNLTGLSYIASGTIVSIASGLAAALMIGLLVRTLADDQAGTRAVALFSFFPASVAMVLPFAEGLAVALACACLYFLVKRQWLWAGVAAGLATASRPTAVLLPVVCAYAAGMAIWRRREWRALLCLPLAPAGLIAYFLFLKARTGSLTAWFQVQEKGWVQKTDWGRGTVRAVRQVFESPLVDLNALSATLALGLTIVGLAALFWWRPPGVVVLYSLLVTALAVTSGIGSRPRYLLSAFPVVIAPGIVAKAPGLYYPLLGMYAAALGVYAILATSGAQAIL